LFHRCCFEQTDPTKSATSKGLNELINLKEKGCVEHPNEYVEAIYNEPDDANNDETYMAMNVPTNEGQEPLYENSNFRILMDTP
jgi:hypothetical protein